MTTQERNLFATATYKQLWFLANPEKVHMSDRLWRLANPEKVKERRRRWNKANPERAKACRAARRKANPEHFKAYHLKRTYNLTLEEWQKLFEYQIQCCAICGRPATDFKNALSVDHDHSTHIVRGLLCWNCNSLLPNRKELISQLKKAIRYLESPPAVKVLGVRLANPVRRKKRKTKRKN